MKKLVAIELQANGYTYCGTYLYVRLMRKKLLNSAGVPLAIIVHAAAIPIFDWKGFSSTSVINPVMDNQNYHYQWLWWLVMASIFFTVPESDIQ